MEKIRREIKLFWTRYSKPLLKFMWIAACVIFVIQSLNYNAKVDREEREKEYLEQTEEREEEIKRNENIEKDKEFISKFIDYCNEKNIEEAYKMVSEDCIQNKYITIKEFEDKYINKIFDTKYDYNITLQEYGTYKVVLTEDILKAGTIQNRRQKECHYIIDEDVLGNKSINLKDI